MRANIMPCRYPLKENEWPMQLQKGLARHGIASTFSQRPGDAEVHAFWGLLRPWGQQALANGCHSLVVERAYLGDRHQWRAMGWNGLNGRADFVNQNVPTDRWQKYWQHQVKPWRNTAGPVYVIGQVPGDAALRGIDIHAWAADTCRQAKALFGDVVYRPHPLDQSGVKIAGVTIDTGPLAVAFERASLIVTYNSNTAVEAVMAGVPAIAMDAGSMAWDVTSHDLETAPYRGDRDQWGIRLAYAQWLPQEIANGEAWAHLRNYFDGR